MSDTTFKVALLVLGAVGALGTWFRGWVAWRSQRHIEKWETFR